MVSRLRIEYVQQKKLRAIYHVRKGKSFSVAATLSGSTKTSVHRWYTEFQTNGLDGLKPKPISGRPKKISSAQNKKLENFVITIASEVRNQNKRHTLRSISRLVKKEFGIRYDPSHYYRILRSLDYEWKRSYLRFPRSEGRHPSRWVKVENLSWKWNKYKQQNKNKIPSFYLESLNQSEEQRQKQYQRDEKLLAEMTKNYSNTNLNAWGQDMGRNEVKNRSQKI